jgi:hypothetical protein
VQVVLEQPVVALSEADRWEMCLGKVLLYCHRGDMRAAQDALDDESMHLAIQMAPAGLESYPRALPLMVQFHMLWDLQQHGIIALAQQRDAASMEQSLRTAMQRVATSVVDVKSHTRMLALVRVLAHMHGLPGVAADAWLQGAEACRVAGHHDAAWPQVLEAERAGCLAAFKLKAKLLWAAARRTEAIVQLQHGLLHLQDVREGPVDLTEPSEGVEASGADARLKLQVRAQLKLLSWQVEQGQGQTAQLQQDFQELLKLRKKDDKAYWEYAVFLHKVYGDLRQRCVTIEWTVVLLRMEPPGLT